MPIETRIVQVETSGQAVIENPTGGSATLARTQTANQERTPGPNPDAGFDEFGLRADYSGTGYIDINGVAGDKLSVDFGEDVPAGTYDVTVRVAASNSRSIAIDVDGTQQGDPQNGQTDSTWSWKTLTFPVTFTADGPNLVTIRQTTGAGPNVDAIALSDRGVAVTFAPPVIETTALEVLENSLVVGPVAASDLEDVGGTPSTLTFSVTGGADETKFTITDAGVLSFVEAPDFEADGSAAGGNTYEVEVTVTDGVETDVQTVIVTVTDDATEAAPRPAIAQQLVQAEAGVVTLAADDGSVTEPLLNDGTTRTESAGGDQILDEAGLRAGYTGAGYMDYGDDAGDSVAYSFEVDEAGIYDLHVRYASQPAGEQERDLLVVVNPGQNKISLGDVEFPTTAAGGTGNASLGFNNWGIKTIEVALEAGVNTVSLAIPAGRGAGPNVDALALTTSGAEANFAAPAFTSPAVFTIAENGTAVGIVAATDADDDTTDGLPAGAPTYAIAGGPDADAFTVDAQTGALALKEAADFEAKTSYAVTVSATDAEDAISTQDVTVEITDVDEGTGPTPTWSFISVPDLFNADYADISGGLNPDIAAVFGPDYANGLIGAPDWAPGDPNSMNPALAQVWKTNTQEMVASAGGSPDLVAIAGDLVYARFTQHIGETERVFDKDDDGDFAQTLNDAGAAYYSWQRKLWEEAGVDTVLGAIGDHEIGDNNWPSGPRTDFVPAMKEAFGEHMVDPLGLAPTWNGVSAFAPEGNGQYDEGSYVYQNKNVLFLTVDVFKYSAAGGLAAGGVEASVDGAHLQWVNEVLDAAEADASVDHVIVQGHVPVLGPVNSIRSSEMKFEGGADSAFWQALQAHGTDEGGKVRAYLAGEVHATTTIHDTSSGIVQISHGATNQADGAAQLDPYWIAFEVTPEGIRGTEYTIVNRNDDTSDTVWEAHRPQSQAVDTVVGTRQLIGTIDIDVSGGTTTVATTGNLQAPLRTEGHQTYVGGPGDDTHSGGIPGAGFTEDNIMYGRGGNDTLSGRAGPDKIFGEEGDDTLDGGTGNDELTGGTGDDTLTGGTGSDLHVFAEGDGNDTITDFEKGTDTIRIGVASFADLTISQDGADALVAYTDGQIRLSGIDSTTLEAEDFGFAPPPLDPLYADKVTLNTGGTAQSAVSDVQTGITVFGDRDFTLGDFPSALTGGRILGANNDDKELAEGTTYLSFEAIQDAFVYVAYHSTATSLPAWLAGPAWVNTGEELILDRSDGTSLPPYNLYGRAVAVGETVTLGGNFGDGSGEGNTGAKNNYLVILDDTKIYADPTLDVLETPIVLQAEDGVLVDAANANASAESKKLTQTNGEVSGGTDNDAFGLRPGYSGEGYVDFGATGDSLTLTFDSPVAGTFDLHIRYASHLSDGADRTADIAVNGGAASTTAFPGASSTDSEVSFDTWKVLTVPATLVEGSNTISLSLTGSGPNVDAIALTTQGEAPDFGPAFSTLPAYEVAEGETAIGTVGAADVDDDYTDGTDTASAVTFALSGTDAGQLAIDASTGALSFKSTTDFENPADDGGDNIYDAVVTVTDTAGNAATQAITVAVSDGADAPTGIVLTAVAVVEEVEGAVVADIAVQDPDSVYGVADIALDDDATFRVIEVDGALKLALAEGVALDFEGASQPSVSVSLVADPGVMAAFTPAPANDPSDDAGPNTAPTAEDGSASTVPGQAVTIPMAALIADAEDADAALVISPTSDDGTVEVVDGAVVFTPADGFVGTATVSYTVTDTGGLSTEGTLTVTVAAAGGPLAFDAGAITGYSTQDNPGQGGQGVSVSDDGTAVTLDGNLWKRAPLPEDYAITENTRLTVDLTVGTSPVPEIVAIGVDGDDNPFDGDGLLFKLAGTQSNNAFVTVQASEDLGGGVQRFTLDLSPLAGQTTGSLVLVNDDDSGAKGFSTFANVELFEQAPGDGGSAPRVVGGGVADLTVLEGGSVEVDLPFAEDDGDAVTLGFEVRDEEGEIVTVDGLALVDGALVGPAPAAPGTYTVTLTATDKDGTATTSFDLSVTDVNDAPMADDVALEPYFETAGQAIDGIDLGQFADFFTDPEGQTLTLTAEGLPAGLSVNDEGVIVGTPTAGGQTTVTIRATDPGGLSDTIEIVLDVQGGQIGDAVVVEAEDFTGLGDAAGFFATGQAGASGDRIIRSNSDVASTVTTDLSANGLVEGWYRVSMTRYDESDGSADYTLSVGDTVLADGKFDEGGTFDDGRTAPQGNAGQTGNLKTVTYDAPVFVTAGTVMTLAGVADGELLRTDKFTFTRVEEPNDVPEGIALDGATVAEAVAGAVVGTLSATDPDGDDAAIDFTVDDDRFEVVGTTLKLKDGEALDFETEPSVDVAITATDADGATATETLTLTVTDVDEEPGAITLTPASVDENTDDLVVGTLSAVDPDGGSVVFTTDDARFEIVGDELRLKAGEALDHEAAEEVTVAISADGGAAQAITVTVGDVNEAPTLTGTLAAASVESAGGSVDLSALTAADVDLDDTTTLVVRSATTDPLPEGVVVANGAVTIPGGLPAGALALEIVAVDAAGLKSAPVALTVTVGEPAPFQQTIQLEARDGSVTILDTDQPGGGQANSDLTQVRDAQNPEPNNEGGKVDNLWPDFEGTGYLDMGGDVGDAASFVIDAPEAGEYVLEFRYNNGSTFNGGLRPMDIAVGGSVQATPNFASNGDWTVWQTETATLTLAEGVNTISLANTVANGPNLDQVVVTRAGVLVDDSADEDGDLALDGDTGELTQTQAASINLNVTGLDDDIVKIEVSFDGGATRIDVTDLPDADGDFVVDGSALAAGPQTATIIVTDDAGNEATDDISFSIAEETTTFDPVTIQAEDDGAITDVGGPGTGPAGRAETVALEDGDTDAFGNILGVTRTGALGPNEGYVDFGENAGDALAFTINVPTAGTYTATFRYANGDSGARPLELTVGGAAPQTLAFDPSLADGSPDWNSWTDLTVDVELTAGDNVVALTIPAGAATGPNVDQVTFAAKGGDTGGGSNPGDPEVFEEVVAINFEAPISGNGNFNAPSSYTTPAGFEADTGEAYGARGNGFTYGWVDVDDANGTVTGTPLAQPTGSMRYKNAAAEASDLQKTYAHFDYPGAPQGDRERAWEMELEDGVYELTVAIGDTAGQYDSDYVLNVEGQRFGPSWAPVNLEGQQLVGGVYDPSFDGEGFRSLLHTGIVEVTDGRLTIDGIDGDNVEIQWLDLERVPDLTPGDDRSADLDYSKFVAAVAANREGQFTIEVGPDGAVPLGIDPTSDIVVGVELQAIDHRGPAVAFTDGVTLVETLTGIEVPIDVQVTGGADSLTIRPLTDLKENTSYTLDIQDVLDLGNLNDSSQPQRQFQDYSTTFVTGEAPEVVAKEVAFTDAVQVTDGGLTSVEFGPDGMLYASTIMGLIHRWEVAANGTVDASSKETLDLGYFTDTGRGIIGIVFDPEDPNTIWVSDNAPIPRQGRSDAIPEFSGQVSKITLGADGSFEGAEAEAYITGLPRSGGDHVTNSLEFRNVGTDADPDYLLYVMQGSNSAAGRADPAWGSRPERLLNAAALEIDHKRDAPEGGFDVQTEPFQGTDPTFRDPNAVFEANGTVDNFYNPFAADAVLRIFGEGIRNAYDLVWHSNGFLYAPTNGTARGGYTLDDPNTTVSEQLTGLDKQFDYFFQVQEGGYYGHPNDLLGNYVVNGGAGGPENIYGSDNAANTSDGGNEYDPSVERDADYDIDGAYSLGFNKSPNGAIEYRGDAFGSNLQGAVLFAQFSQGDNVRVINVDPVTGRVTGDDVLRRPNGEVIDDYIDPLDLIENPVTGQIYLMTLNRGSGESQIVLLTPAPGGVTSDLTADEGGDLSLTVDASDPAAAVVTIAGADADLTSRTLTFTDGAETVAETVAGNGTFTVDLSALSGAVSATLDVEDGSGNTAAATTGFSIGGGPGNGTFLDATAFTVTSTLTGNAATVVRRLDDASTHESGNGNDANGDGLNDNHDGIAYLDPNGGAEDKAEFTFDAPAAGTYTFTFRMAANNDRSIAFRTGDQTETVTVNTGSFTAWQDLDVVLTLVEGENTIVINQPGGTAPNVDSVTITPLAIADTTADEGGDLDLVAVDLDDPAQATFSVSGADSDLTSFTVVFTDADGATVTAPLTADGDFDGPFTVDLSPLSGEVTAVATVFDGTNTATQSASFTLGGGVGNDGTEEVGGQTFVIYEAENATLDGPVVVTEDRTQSGDFVDFDGTTDQTVTWTVSVPQDGDYAVDILYALGSNKTARPLTLSVDGGAGQVLAFEPNSNTAETDWGPQSFQLNLTAGTHSIAVTAPGANGPNLDYLRISQSPLTEPLDLTADEDDDLALTVVDQSDASAVVFAVAGLDADIDTIEVAFNGGDPQPVTLVDGQFTADTGIAFGQIEAALTVEDDADNTKTVTAAFAVAPDGNPNADIEVQSLDPTFFEDRLHFSFVNNSDGRLSKETAQFEIANTGSETLDILEFTISEFYSVVDPAGLAGASIAAGDSLVVTVEFDGSTGGPDGFPSRPSSVSGVYEGTLSLLTNDAEDPFTTLDLAAFWQPAQEGGNEPNVNEVWQVLGFGNEIAGLPFAGGGQDSILDFDDLYLPAPGQEGVEILSPYWRIADGASEASATIIAAYNASASAGLGIHAPGNKGQDKGLAAWGPNAQSQTLFPLKGNGDFATLTFGDGFIPDAWTGDDVFGIEMAGLSTDPTLNNSGNGTPSQNALDANYGVGTYKVTGTGANAVVTDAEGNVVEDGYTVRMFQALDAAGNPIENVYLGMMDYTGINYDYNDNMFLFEGIAPVGSGGSLVVSGLDDAAADDRLVFTNIDNPNNAGGLQQNFRNSAEITLTNEGIGPLTVTGLTISGADAADFQVSALPGPIAPGASAIVTVTFAGSDPTGADNMAELRNATLTVESDAFGAAPAIRLAGLAQNQSESGEEPTVAQVVEAFGYGTDVQQGSLNGGGDVETIGDEVLMPYLERLDSSQPVEVINLAAFLQQTNVSRLHVHELDDDGLTQLFAGDDQQGQTVLPDGLVAGPGDTGSVGRASIDRDEPFGLKVTIDGRPTFAAWTDPDANVADPELGVNDEGHYIRFFQAKDGNGDVIEGTYIGIQDYPGGGNFDYNDAMFLVRNVQPHTLTAANDADQNGVNDALETDADGDGLAAFFDGDDAPSVQTAFGGTPWAVDGDEVTVMASSFDEGGQGVAYNDDGTKSGQQGVRPGTNVDISNGTGAVGYTNAGEWLEYTIDVAEAGQHRLVFNSSSPSNGRTLAASFAKDGSVYETATAQVPNTGAYTTYADTQAVTVDLEAGVQVLRVTFPINEQDLMSFTLAPVETDQNAAPVGTDIAAQDATEGQGFTLDVSGSFTDADPLTFTADGLPAGLSISEAGVITGTPAVDGTFGVTVTASDGELTASEAFTLTVADAPPGDGQEPFAGRGSIGLVDGAITVDAADYDEGGQGVAYLDAAGLQGGSNGGRAGSAVEITGLGDVGWISTGEWLEYTVDLAAGTYDLDLLMALGGGTGRSAVVDFYRPGEGTPYASSGSIANPSTGGWTTFQTRSASDIALEGGEQVVRITFAGGSQDIRSFTLTQTDADENQPPVAGEFADTSVTEGEAISLDLSGVFSDPDAGDTLSYSVSGLAGLSISSSGVVTGTAPEVGADTDFQVTVTASDGALTASETFTLTVEDEPDTGSGQAPFPGSRTLDQSLTVDATNFDAGGQGVSWNDDDGLNGGGQSRSDTDVELVGSQQDIGYVEQGEWVEYTIDVAEAGTYDLSLVAKTPIGGNSIAVSLEDGPPLATFALEDSNGGSNGFGGTTFGPTGAQSIQLAAGEQTLRFTFDGTSADNGYLLDMRSFSLEKTAGSGGGSGGSDVVGEAGTVTFAQADASEWQSVTFTEALENPAVVMGPISLNGAQQATMRVRDVTETGFEYQLDEWDYLDGGHIEETVSWVAIESGTHQIGGQTVVAGVGSASGTGGSIAFGTGFDAVPVVAAQVTSTNDGDAVTDRIDAVTATGFDVALDDQEANTGTHAAESLAWIAVQQGGAASAGVWAGATGDAVTDDPFTQSFGSDFGDDFAFVADMQTEDGGDPAVVRLSSLTDGSATFFIEEEQSADDETGHTTEVVGSFGIATGLIVSDDPLV
jgi:hypothetical protein